MTKNDVAYVTALLERGLIHGRVLELGAGYGGETCRILVEKHGCSYSATDVAPSSGVSFVADFADTDSVRRAFGDATFDTVLVLNVLEHTFDPVRIVDNALGLVADGGAVVVVAPAAWTLHDYPIDCCRLLPHWYEQYASSRDVELPADVFQYLGRGPVGAFKDNTGAYQFPLPTSETVHYWWSKAVQRAFGTFGRGMSYPSHLAIGAVFVKRRAPS